MKTIGMFERQALAWQIRYAQQFPGMTMHVDESDTWVVGVTGVTGAGKSTLVRQLAVAFRKKDMRVVALLIDPSSKKRGWAILGDRNRLRCDELDTDKGVFIRSLATRGETSAVTNSLSKIIAYAKLFSDVVIVETAGAGQTDVEIREHVDTLVQVLEPLGDSLNLLKAGQGEEANIFMVNDREDFKSGKKFFASADANLGEQLLDDGWKKRVYLANAATGSGVDKVIEGLFEHRDFQKTKKN